MAADPELAVTVLGASGVTGRQALPYLRRRSGEAGLRWGIAGRSRERLESLIADWPAAERPEVLLVDTAAGTGVDDAVGRSRAIVNFAGPFARMAPPVIEACVAAGSAYVDVTGEIDFAARIAERWHHEAERTGARIVQVCGFEALPFDLLAAAAIERLRAHDGEDVAAIDAVFSGSPPPGMPRASDLVSHGTFESLREAIAGDGARVLGDPAALIGDLAVPQEVRAASPIRSRPRWSPELGPLAPMMPSPIINPPVIQRSLALSGHPPVPYREAVTAESLVPTRPLQAVAAGSIAGLSGGLALLARAPARVRRAGAAALKLASPAGGPREDRLEAWRWSVECTALGVGGGEARTRVDADGHPGYLATSRMTTEAALILADPDARTPDRAGVLTPATALGTAELDRFAEAGVRFGPARYQASSS